jgi:putative NADPH-quinone reductase
MPLLAHKKALIMNTTIFDERSYREEGLDAAMKIVIDEFALRYPGIEHVEYRYFYAVHGANEVTRLRYLEKAYQLGSQF